MGKSLLDSFNDLNSTGSNSQPESYMLKKPKPRVKRLMRISAELHVSPPIHDPQLGQKTLHSRFFLTDLAETSIILSTTESLDIGQGVCIQLPFPRQISICGRVTARAGEQAHNRIIGSSAGFHHRIKITFEPASEDERLQIQDLFRLTLSEFSSTI